MRIFDMDIDLRVDDKEFKGNIRDVLKINEGQIHDELIEQPSTYAWFATLTEIAKANVEKHKMNIKVLRARLDEEKRELLGKGGVKVTEPKVESAIEKDERLIVLVEEMIELSKNASILKALTDALNQRKDMLIQLSSFKRQEMFMGDYPDLNNVRNKNR